MKKLVITDEPDSQATEVLLAECEALTAKLKAKGVEPPDFESPAPDDVSGTSEFEARQAYAGSLRTLLTAPPARPAAAPASPVAASASFAQSRTRPTPSRTGASRQSAPPANDRPIARSAQERLAELRGTPVPRRPSPGPLARFLAEPAARCAELRLKLQTPQEARVRRFQTSAVERVNRILERTN